MALASREVAPPASTEAEPAWAKECPTDDSTLATNYALVGQLGQSGSPEEQLAELTRQFQGAGSMSPLQQAELIAVVVQFYPPTVVDGFRDWLSTSPTHPYEAAMELDRNSVGGLAPGILPGLAASAMMTGAERGNAFVDAFMDAAEGQLDAATLKAVASKLHQGSALSAVFPVFFLKGALLGAATEIGELVALVQDIPAVLESLDGLIRMVLGEDGVEFAGILGEEMGVAFGGDIASVATMDLPGVCVWMGNKAGPILADILLGLVTGGAIAVGSRALAFLAKNGADIAGDLVSLAAHAVDTLEDATSTAQMVTPDGMVVRGVPGPSGSKKGPRDPDLLARMYDHSDGGRSELSPLGEGPEVDAMSIHDVPRTPDNARAKRPDIQEFDIDKKGGREREFRDRKGDLIDRDHWPSNAAVIQAIERQMGGRELEPKLEKWLYENTPTVALRTELHSLRRTTGGKNTATQIASDAGDLRAAFELDAQEFRRLALREGFDLDEVDEVIVAMREALEELGVFEWVE